MYLKILAYFIFIFVVFNFFYKENIINIILVTLLYAVFLIKNIHNFFHGYISSTIIILFLIFNYNVYIKIYYDTINDDKFTMQEEMNDIARRSKEFLSKDSLVLIPPTYTARSFLEHGIYFSIKDGAAYLWKRGFEKEFIRRLKLLGITYTPGIMLKDDIIHEQFMKHIETSLPRVKNEGVTHVIFPQEIPLKTRANILAENKRFYLMTIEHAIESLQLSQMQAG